MYSRVQPAACLVDKTDLCIILAGYSAEMDEMLESNPGLRSRFPNVFRCPDYDVDELFQIGLLTLERAGHSFDESGAEAFRSLIAPEMNGRDVRTLLERLMKVAAFRADQDTIDIGDNATLAECVQFAEKMLIITADDVDTFSGIPPLASKDNETTKNEVSE